MKSQTSKCQYLPFGRQLQVLPDASAGARPIGRQDVVRIECERCGNSGRAAVFERWGRLAGEQGGQGRRRVCCEFTAPK